MRWLRRLLEAAPDEALRLPPDPRQHGPVEDRLEWSCPALHGRQRTRCGLPKAPNQATCGREHCRKWASKQKAEERPRGRAKVLSMGGRG